MVSIKIQFRRNMKIPYFLVVWTVEKTDVLF